MKYYCPKEFMPFWVTGFCDRSASFGVSVYRKGVKRYPKLVFEVMIDVRDVHILYGLKEFFGVGNVYVGRKNATYHVASLSELEAIIAHFTSFPLISPKLLVFSIWVEAFHLVTASLHQTTEGMLRLVALSRAVGRGLSKVVTETFPGVTAVNLPTYVVPVTTETISKWWLSGYLAVYFSLNMYIGGGSWGDTVYNKYRHSFMTSFDIISKSLAIVIADTLGVPYYERSDGFRVDVMAQSSMECDLITDFFSEYPLYSHKLEQYEIWSEYVDMLKLQRDDGAHLVKYYRRREQYLSKLVGKFHKTQQ